tara:strand:+ start:545 stop:2587 length:2043 start_codon:yes stop_codon:yes gene_type:complete
MLPSVYQETNNTIYSSEETKEILRKNKENNSNIFNGSVELSNENCKVVKNMIPKIKDFTSLSDNIFVDIYDIPGLNDAKTRDIYYKWIEDNFSELDIIIHIVDINSPLNTSDQIDILKMLIKNIDQEKKKNGRDVFLLTLVNKCDEMDQEDGVFVMDDEDQENYDNIIKTTEEIIKEILGADTTDLRPLGQWCSAKGDVLLNYDFTPISAADTFVYRMLHNDPSVEMDMKLLQKFGINEVGRRAWNKMDDEGRRELIKEHFEEADISDTLEITGYLQFTEILKKYLTKDRQSKILIDRIKQELQNEDLIKKNITTDKGELQKLIQIYNSYSSRVWVVDKLFKTNNSSIVTDLINTHISRWISDISDLSNGSVESIQRLEEYKYAVNEIREKVDPYALSNNIKMKIDEEKGQRWSDSFGKSFQAYKDAIPHSMTFGLRSLMEGYSKLQNEYYIRILENENTYDDFPNNIFSNIDKLRENSYDSVESTIDNVIQKMEQTIITKGDSELENWLQKDKSPFSGYYEVCESSENSIIQFCEKLMNNYCYPKEKIIKYLQNYLTQRYTVMGRVQSDENTFNKFSKVFGHVKENYVKSYIILLDDWWGGVATDNEYFNNLYFVNKSNLFRANNLQYSQDINYYKEKKNILAIPLYLYGMMDEGDESGDESDYSSTCGDDGISDNESE